MKTAQQLVVGLAAAIGTALLVFAREHGSSAPTGAGSPLDRAMDELQAWKGRTETDAAVADRLARYWAAAGLSTPPPPATAWSAAFISYLAREALEGNQSHIGYVRSAWRDRNELRHGRYWAFQPWELSLRPGDIVVEGREPVSWNDVTHGVDFKASHGDLVVSAGPTQATAIGGNLQNSVRTRVIPVDPEGHPSNAAVYAVLRRAAAYGPPPVA